MRHRDTLIGQLEHNLGEVWSMLLEDGKCIEGRIKSIDKKRKIVTLTITPLGKLIAAQNKCNSKQELNVALDAIENNAGNRVRYKDIAVEDIKRFPY